MAGNVASDAEPPVGGAAMKRKAADDADLPLAATPAVFPAAASADQADARSRSTPTSTSTCVVVALRLAASALRFRGSCSDGCILAADAFDSGAFALAHATTCGVGSSNEDKDDADADADKEDRTFSCASLDVAPASASAPAPTPSATEKPQSLLPQTHRLIRTENQSVNGSNGSEAWANRVAAEVPAESKALPSPFSLELDDDS